MQKSRMIGNYIQEKANEKGISISELSSILGCKDYQTHSFLKGRSLASFKQISDLARRLDVTVSDVLQGDVDVYNKTVVHCMNDFDDTSSREMILDFIDDYMDIRDSIML